VHPFNALGPPDRGGRSARSSRPPAGRT
jgi:hypothetical protein